MGHQGGSWVFRATEVLEVANGRVSTTALPNQVPAVRGWRKRHLSRINGLLDAQFRRRCAARIPQNHRNVADVRRRQWNGQHIVVVDVTRTVPHSNVDLVVEVGSQGVGGTAIPIHFERHQVLASSEMGVENLATHEVRGPACAAPQSHCQRSECTVNGLFQGSLKFDFNHLSGRHKVRAHTG